MNKHTTELYLSKVKSKEESLLSLKFILVLITPSPTLNMPT